MPFNRREVDDLLARCHRRCCVCHRFCGVKMETDHIDPSSPGGSDSIDNAIPVCFDCHAEIHSYNDDHPRGRKFTEAELRQHKKQWVEICAQHPERLSAESREPEVGPVQALIDEIEFNIAAAKAAAGGRSCPLRDEQFARIIRTGSLAILKPSLKKAVIGAYVAAGHASSVGQAVLSKTAGGLSQSLRGGGDPQQAFSDCERRLVNARRLLLKCLRHEGRVG
ncbi:MAG: HNH endonuclease [Deltaproteobacteria bacterium]|nr:HNH endonuclease [Deltaproteobacteria bacterium]